MMVFPASSLSSVSAAALRGTLKVAMPAIAQASQGNDALRTDVFMASRLLPDNLLQLPHRCGSAAPRAGPIRAATVRERGTQLRSGIDLTLGQHTSQRSRAVRKALHRRSERIQHRYV